VSASSFAVALVLVLAAPALALAQTPPNPPEAAQTAPSNAARADALFQEGKKLLEQGNAAEACPLLAQSDALDPTVSTLGLLAACHEQQGLLATALREFRATEKRAAAANDGRAEFARQRAAALEASAPRLSIRLAAPLPGIEVLRDGEAVAPEGLGAEAPVDPGAHEIVVRAPQHQEWRTTLTLKPGDRLIAGVPPLAEVAPPPAAAQVPPPAPTPSPARRTAALVTGALGLAGMGIGAALGVLAIRQNDDSNAVRATCDTPATCAPGRDARDASFRSAAGSTVAFVAGGAGLLTGVVLLAIQPSARPVARAITVAPFAGSGGGGAVIVGRF